MNLPKNFDNLTEWAKRLVSTLERELAPSAPEAVETPQSAILFLPRSGAYTNGTIYWEPGYPTLVGTISNKVVRIWRNDAGQTQFDFTEEFDSITIKTEGGRVYSGRLISPLSVITDLLVEADGEFLIKK